jgi:prevent-host-death family protein
MAEMTATEAKNRFGEVIEIARREPVRVQRNGRTAVVVVDAEQYDRLVARAEAATTSPLMEKLLTRSIERRRSLYEALAK